MPEVRARRIFGVAVATSPCLVTKRTADACRSFETRASGVATIRRGLSAVRYAMGTDAIASMSGQSYTERSFAMRRPS